MPPKSHQPLAAVQIPDALLKVQTVTAVTGLSESSVRRLVAVGKFPRPITTGERCSRWRAGAVEQFDKTPVAQEACRIHFVSENGPISRQRHGTRMPLVTGDSPSLLAQEFRLTA